VGNSGHYVLVEVIMETELIYAAYVDNNDYVVVNGEVLGYVYSVNDQGDTLVFDIVDEDNEHTPLERTPFAAVEIVLTFEEPFEFEDVPIEDDEDEQ
jgi:hypothetical protein